MNLKKITLTIAIGTMINFELPFVGISLENLLLVPLFILTFLNVTSQRIRYQIKPLILIFSLITIISLLLSAIQIPDVLLDFNLLVIKNICVAFLIYVNWINIEYKNVKYRLLAYTIYGSIFLVSFKFLNSGIALGNKNLMSDAHLNPNSIINSIVLLLIFRLIVTKQRPAYHYIPNFFTIFLSLVLNTRQNLISAVLTLTSLMRAYWVLSLLLITSIWFSFGNVITDKLKYVIKGAHLLFALNPNSSIRFRWSLEGYQKLVREPLYPTFEHPIDNFFLTFMLQTTTVSGLITIAFVIVSLTKLWAISAGAALGLLVLLLLQDLQTEAIFWLIVLLLLGDLRKSKRLT